MKKHRKPQAPKIVICRPVPGAETSIGHGHRWAILGRFRRPALPFDLFRLRRVDNGKIIVVSDTILQTAFMNRPFSKP